MLRTYRRTAIALAVSLLPASAALAQASTQVASATQLDTVEITSFGRGQVRQVESVSRAELEQLPAGSSPLAAVSRLPSVNFQSADAFGSYEWSTRLTVRGFNQNQLGFTLDGVPLGDMSYANFNGLHISRAIATENIARTTLSPGTGELGIASSSNLGGTLQFFSLDPSNQAGLTAAQTFGSYNTRRTFLRGETGDFGFGKLALSFADQNSEKWKGHGEQRQQQFNAKYVVQLGEHKLSAFANASRRREIDYQDMSLEMINRLGYKWDNFYPDFQAAVNAANTLCQSSNYTSQCDDAYYAGSGLRNDELYGATFDARLNPNATLSTTVYHHHNKGAGLWYTPYVASPNGTPISVRTTEYGISRSGVLSALSYTIGSHDLKTGVWYEDNDFDQARRFYSIDPNAVPSPYDFPSNPFATSWAYRFNTKTKQFFAEDSYTVSDRLTLSAGFKSLSSDINATLVTGNPAARPQGSISASKGFLPQVGVKYALSNNDELFAGVAQNMRAFQGSGTGLSPFATTTAGFNAIRDQLKPETSTTVEGGWRFFHQSVEGVVAVYNVEFKDRLLAVQQGSGIVGNPPVLGNVGGARMTGLEAALNYKLTPAWSWYNGASYTDAVYRDDYTSNGVTYATAGKRIVDVPKVMAKSILSYASEGYFGNIGVDYMSSRTYTYLNDASVPGRTLVSAGVGYRAKAWSMLKEPSVQLNVSNLTNKRYISTIGSNGFVNSDPSGTAQTLLLGAPREVFVTFSAKL